MNAFFAQTFDGGLSVPGTGTAQKQSVPTAPIHGQSTPVDGSESDWIARMALGDEAALGQLYEHCVSHVYGLAIRITRDAALAEEVVSDTFLQAWRTASTFDTGRGKPIAWLLTITRSRGLDALRRADRAESVADVQVAAEQARAANGETEQFAAAAIVSDDPIDQLVACDRDKQLHAALGMLSAVQRQLISLAFFRGLTHSEIAAHIAMPLGTVKSHLRQGQRELKGLLAASSDKQGTQQ